MIKVDVKMPSKADLMRGGDGRGRKANHQEGEGCGSAARWSHRAI
jgi:hypothetical protein